MIRRFLEWRRRRKIAKSLEKTMYKLTLNDIGPIYGVYRQKGESDKEYKNRIMKAARTIDKVQIPTGKQEDKR